MYKNAASRETDIFLLRLLKSRFFTNASLSPAMNNRPCMGVSALFSVQKIKLSWEAPHRFLFPWIISCCNKSGNGSSTVRGLLFLGSFRPSVLPHAPRTYKQSGPMSCIRNAIISPCLMPVTAASILASFTLSSFHPARKVAAVAAGDKIFCSF